MPLRKPIVAGNWKMNKPFGDAVALAAAIKRDIEQVTEVEVVLCPPFTALKAVGDIIADSRIKLGAQNMHWEKDGAYTGEISASMLTSVGCKYVILGHSERRGYFHETSEIVNRKLKAALAAGLFPIVCVGETLEERDRGQTKQVIETQIGKSLADIGNDLLKVVIAYEPVWAIGTGRTATPAQAQEVHAFLRHVLSSLVGAEVANVVRIQYGGSVKPSNAKELFSQPDIAGGLIGGAALDAASFVDIVKAAV